MILKIGVVMEKSRFILFFLIISASTLFAQSGKAKSLEIGNKWIYLFEGGQAPYSTEIVIGDTVFNKKKYAEIMIDSIYFKYQRADSVRIYQFNPADSQETVIADFSLNVNDFLDPSAIYPSIVTTKYSTDIWGRTLEEECISFDYPDLYYYDECYTTFIGLTDGSYGGASGNYEVTLKAAFIEGKVYGDTALLSIKKSQKILPGNFQLFQNYPNPFNPSTVISWQLVKSSFVTIKIYDAIGREITTLVSERQSAGFHQINFSSEKYKLSSGVYFVRMEVFNKSNQILYSQTKKLSLIK